MKVSCPFGWNFSRGSASPPNKPLGGVRCSEVWIVAWSLPGGYLCEAVRFEIREEPLSAVCCHCRGCQQPHAAPFAALALVPPGGVVLTRSTPARHEAVANSGAATFREFCASCGTHLFSGGADFPEFRAVKLLALDDPTSIIPVAHVWAKRAVPWCPPSDELPRYDEQPEIEELRGLWATAKSSSA